MKQKEIKKKKNGTARGNINVEMLEAKIKRTESAKNAAKIAADREKAALASGARYRQINSKTWVLEKMI